MGGFGQGLLKPALSIEFQNILQEPTEGNGQQTHTSASNSRSVTKGYSGFAATGECYSLGQTQTASFFNAVYNPRAPETEGNSGKLSKQTTVGLTNNVLTALKSSSPRSGSHPYQVSFQNTR